MAMESYYQHPYVQNQLKFETYQSPILMKPSPRPSPTCQDYSIPLHVDCSVEYELPECAKPPQGVKIEPLLMIHPCHFRNLERQRRRPFENNMPQNSIISTSLPQHQTQQTTKNTRVINNLNNTNLNSISNKSSNQIQKQQHQHQPISISNRNMNNNFVYNCDFTTHLLDYQTNNSTSNNSNSSNPSATTVLNNSNNNSGQRFRNSNSNNLIRNHPYAMPCVPRYPDIHYSTTHLPTLIYNV